jgi:hypothetical protein
MISPTSEIYKLTPEETTLGLANRSIFRLFCCNQPMQQFYVESHLPTIERPFGLSLINLECPLCKRQLQLEAIAGKQRFDVVADHLDIPILKRDL